MVEILRSKFQWYDNLHNILQCSACSDCENSEISIYECIEKHLICEKCKLENNCPICQNSTTSRNRLAEDFRSKFQRIKEYLLNVLRLRDAEKLSLQDLESVATQTDGVVDEQGVKDDETSEVESWTDLSTANGCTTIKEEKMLLRSQDESQYCPCCISSCNKMVSFSQLVDHILIAHSSEFQEIPLGANNIFFHMERKFSMAKPPYDTVFSIPKVGTFSLKLYINETGDFIGFVALINDASSTMSCCHSQFSYKLRISCCGQHKDHEYSGDVQSYEILIKDPRRKCVIVNSSRTKHMKHLPQLSYSVILTRKLIRGTPTQKKKKRPTKKAINYQRNCTNAPISRCRIIDA